MSDASLREHFPEVTWDEPLLVSVMGHESRWVCRYCIAQRGLKADRIERTPFAFLSRNQATEHIERKHGHPRTPNP